MLNGLHGLLHLLQKLEGEVGRGPAIAVLELESHRRDHQSSRRRSTILKLFCFDPGVESTLGAWKALYWCESSKLHMV